MGVHGLWKLLGISAERIDLRRLRTRRLAIDVSIWLTQFIKAMRDPDGNLLPNAHIIGKPHPTKNRPKVPWRRLRAATNRKSEVYKFAWVGSRICVGALLRLDSVVDFCCFCVDFFCRCLEAFVCAVVSWHSSGVCV